MLNIPFKKVNDRAKRLIIYPNPVPEPTIWLQQKPRMSSARIMMEVRRRLWQEACSENTGFYQTDKLMDRIKFLDKRIVKRLVTPEEIEAHKQNVQLRIEAMAQLQILKTPKHTP